MGGSILVKIGKTLGQWSIGRWMGEGHRDINRDRGREGREANDAKILSLEQLGDLEIVFSNLGPCTVEPADSFLRCHFLEHREHA